jgi:hypothetical protein
VTARGIVLERHARDRNGSAAAGPPAPAPSGSLHQRHLTIQLSVDGEQEPDYHVERRLDEREAKLFFKVWSAIRGNVGTQE